MKHDELDKAKRWVVLIAGISVILTMFFIAFQAYEMQTGLVDTHDLAVAAKTQADAAKAQADNTKTIAESAKSQAANTEKLATAADNQAKAAINAAKGSLKLDVNSFQVSNTPFVTLENVRLLQKAWDSSLPAVSQADFISGSGLLLICEYLDQSRAGEQNDSITTPTMQRLASHHLD